VRRQLDRILPNGGLDAVRQIALFVGAYVLYQLVRGLASGSMPDIARASWNATKIIDLERTLHVFVEPAVQQWALNLHWLMDFSTWFYINGNYAITGGVLLWIYLRRNDSFYFVRNTFMVAMVIALVGYSVYPTAPPRLMPEWGFTDIVAQVTGVHTGGVHGSANAFLNLYAAVPSMHVCFALMAGVAMVKLSTNRIVRALWAVYAPFVAFVVIATANHYLTDAFLGAATAAIAALTARQLARIRPEAWTFGSGSGSGGEATA
jgi:hypothetical protein